MPYLQIRPRLRDLPLEMGLLGPSRSPLCRLGPLEGRVRGLAHAHLTGRSAEATAGGRMAEASALPTYQRSAEEIPAMETHSLTMAMMQSSKAGFVKKSTWSKYVARALELRERLSAKNLAIVMISAAKANVRDPSFYEPMAERLATKARNYVATYREDPASFFADAYKAEFTAFSIYTALTACSLAGYADERLVKALLKASEIKLLHFNSLLDRVVAGGGSPVWDKGGAIARDDRFTFEDVAGILHAFAASSVESPHMVRKYGETFRKMCRVAASGELRELQLGEPTPRAFAISLNALVRLGDRSEELYRLGLEHLLKNVEELSPRDMAMAYGAVVKIRTTRAEFEDSSSLLPEVTARVLEKTSGSLIDPESLVSLSASFACLTASDVWEGPEREAMRVRFKALFEEAACLVLAEHEFEGPSLVQLLHNAALLSAMPAAMVIMSSQSLKTVGLTGATRDVLKLVTSLGAIYASTDSACLKEMAHEHLVTAVRQYGRRLNYALSPHTMGLPKTRPRPPSLYGILKLEAKGRPEGKDAEMNTDWKELTAEIAGFSADNVEALASILNSICKFRQSRELAGFVGLACEFCNRFFKFHVQEPESKALQLDTISAIVNALSRYRIKNRALMENFSKLIAGDVQARIEAGDFQRLNYVALFNLVHSYAKLGLPENKLFGPRGQAKLPGRRSGEDVHRAMFRTVSNLISVCDMHRVNLQMATNCLYGLALVGFDKFSRVALVRLLDRFAEAFWEQRSELSSSDGISHPEGSHVRDYIAPFDSGAERSCGGNRELHSQIDIVTMMLHLTANSDFFKTRVFRRYWSRVRRVQSASSTGLGSSWGSAEGQASCKPQGQEGQREGSGGAARMSGLHRSVLSALRGRYEAIRSEVPWRRGTYSIDVELGNGRSRKLVEIDGPCHYYAQSSELVSSTRAKHFIMTSYGHRLVHIPYFEWARCEDDGPRLEYLASKLAGRSPGRRAGCVENPPPAVVPAGRV